MEVTQASAITTTAGATTDTAAVRTATAAFAATTAKIDNDDDEDDSADDMDCCKSTCRGFHLISQRFADGSHSADVKGYNPSIPPVQKDTILPFRQCKRIQSFHSAGVKGYNPSIPPV